MKYLLNKKTICFSSNDLNPMKFLLITFIFFAGCNKIFTNQIRSSSNSKRFISERSGKLKGHMALEIQGSSPDSSTLLLSASIRPFKNFGLAQVEWKVPESVGVQEGLIQQELELSQGQTYKVSLTLNTNHLRNGDHIFLLVYKMVNGEKHGTTVSYTYRSSEGNSD